MSTPSYFSSIEEAAPDAILGTALAFQADPSSNKVNLGIGAYRTEEGKPLVFRVVRQVEKQLAADESLNKEYLPIDGLGELVLPTQRLVFGDCKAIVEKRICSAQCLSGTGALRAAAEFIKTFLKDVKVVYLSAPTWENHRRIFEFAGIPTKEYPYWEQSSRSIDFNGMLRALSSAEPCSAVILHACAHNPTGMDPSRDQWKQIAETIKRRRLVPILDMAYQGFASGDLNEDAWAIRLFEQMGCELFACQSFAKNLGLYGERIGMLHIVCADADRAKCVLSCLKLVLRAMHSNPPLHGARIVAAILNSKRLFDEWGSELKEVSGRITRMRWDLRRGLEALGTPGKWDHITQQIGMFSYTGLSPSECERMINTWHVYMLKNGRISMAGLNSSNMQYVVKAIDECVRFTTQGNSRI